MNHKLANALACCLLLAGTAASAQEPAQNIDPARHGNLAAAQDMVREAYDKVSVAQFDNNSQLGGHAAHAKELMREANDEIKMAAIVANGGVVQPFVPGLCEGRGVYVEGSGQMARVLPRTP
jgi:hypothetical protein